MNLTLVSVSLPSTTYSVSHPHRHPDLHLPASLSLPTTLRRRRRDIRHRQAVMGLVGEAGEGGGGGWLRQRVVSREGERLKLFYGHRLSPSPPPNLLPRSPVYNPWRSPASYICRPWDKGYISLLQDHWPVTKEHIPALLSAHHQPP